MERTLQVLDYAVLVINGREGVQGHTATLWKLAGKYDVPLFIFVNKTDLEGVNRDDVMEELRGRLDQRCIAFDMEHDGEWMEQTAMCDEALLEELLKMVRDLGHDRTFEHMKYLLGCEKDY